MEEFKNKLQLRMLILTVTMVAISFLFQMLRRDQNLTSPLTNFQIQLQVALGVVLYIALLINWAKATLAIRNPDKLKRLYDTEMDKRQVLLRQKSHSTVSRILLVVLSTGTVVAGNYNATAFLTLLGATCVVGLVYRALLTHYQRTH